MKKNITDMAFCGGAPLFESPLPVGQINIPKWERFTEMADGIFKRAYFTNHGVLTQEFESRLCDFFGTRNALTISNATIGLTAAAIALGLPVGGQVIVPAFTFAATVQALTWAGLKPLFCDVNPETHSLDLLEVERLLIKYKPCAILGVHLWGYMGSAVPLTSLAKQYNVPIFFDAAQATGCAIHTKQASMFGECSIFSFHATKILTSAEGGCITTDDNTLAERIRNIRSSYGRHETIPVPFALNGGFSEMQAAMGLLSLEDFQENCMANKQRFDSYASIIAHIPGLSLFDPRCGMTPSLPETSDVKTQHNWQYIVLEVDENIFGISRDELVRLMKAENVLCRRYFTPGMHRCPPYCHDFSHSTETLPHTDALCHRILQMPSGQAVTPKIIQDIGNCLAFIHNHAAKLRQVL